MFEKLANEKPEPGEFTKKVYRYMNELMLSEPCTGNELNETMLTKYGKFLKEACDIIDNLQADAPAQIVQQRIIRGQKNIIDRQNDENRTLSETIDRLQAKNKQSARRIEKLEKMLRNIHFLKE